MVTTALRVALALLPLLVSPARATSPEFSGDLHFPLHARATNKDGSSPLYKNPHADIESRVNDLLPRMTIEEKVAQLYVLSLLKCCSYLRVA